MKRDRQTAILRMIREEEIGTQEELAERLRASGYSVTQATVSRDIRELFLTKVTIGGGKQKYTVMREHGPNMEEKYTRVLREGLEDIEAAQNAYDLNRAAELKYGTLPTLQKELAEQEKK